MSETPERRATLTAGQLMARQADDLATRTVATVSALRVLSRDEDDDGRALLQASLIMVSAISVARAIGARAAALRFGRETYAPMPVSPEKHEQLDAALATCFDSPDARAVSTMVRSETVRAAADEFAAQSVEAVASPDFDLEDATEDLEDSDDDEPDDDDTDDDTDYKDDERLRREAEEESERFSREYDEEMEKYLDRMDREDEEDYLKWEKEQNRIYDEEERLEAEEESKRYELPPAPEPEKEWAHVLHNDPEPCGRCRLAKGRRIKFPQHFKGIHPNCGCFTELTLVPIRLADKANKRKVKK